MTRLTDAQLAEAKQAAAALRLKAKRLDAMASADRERGDSVSQCMWKLEAKSLRDQARQHDERIQSERFWRQMDKLLPART